MKEGIYSFERKKFLFFIVLFTGTNFPRLIANDKCTSLSTSINGFSRKITNILLLIWKDITALLSQTILLFIRKDIFLHLLYKKEGISFNEKDICWALFSESNILILIGKEVYKHIPFQERMVFPLLSKIFGGLSVKSKNILWLM